MNVRSSDIYLNSLCLTAYAPGEKATELARAVVKMFDEISAEEKTLMSPINLLYINLLREVSKGNLNLSNRAEVADTLLKYSQDPRFKDCKFQFDELKNLLTPTEPVSDNRIRTLFKRVQNNITWMRGDRRVRKMLMSFRNLSSSEADVEKQTELLSQLLEASHRLSEDLSGEDLNTGEEAPIDEIDMADPKSISRALTAQTKKDSGERIRFGWQGFNRMWGPKKSAAYGEMCAVAARSHNYKSGLLMDITRWICTLNKPPDTSGLTPIVLFVSLENEVQENLINWYKQLYRTTYLKDPEDLTPEEITEYVSREFNKNGFRLIAKRRMGDNFGYDEYDKMVEDEEKKHGGKVVATILDYITLCHRCKEDSSRNDAAQLQKMAERFHDHTAHHSIFFFTGLQMDTNASQLAVSGKHNIVKQYGEFHLADAKGLRRVFDFMCFLEIEKNHHNIPYLTLAWSKHRYVNDTPIEDKYTAYRFTNLGIIDDVNGADMSIKDIYADDPELGENESLAEVSVF